jgi:hypothetical protein
MAVSRAIEITKRRQAPVNLNRAAQQQQQRTGRTEPLDVDKLNRLIRTIDRTWTLPRSGSKEPVGSNFQARHQPGSLTIAFLVSVQEDVRVDLQGSSWGLSAGRLWHHVLQLLPRARYSSNILFVSC